MGLNFQMDFTIIKKNPAAWSGSVLAGFFYIFMQNVLPCLSYVLLKYGVPVILLQV